MSTTANLYFPSDRLPVLLGLFAAIPVTVESSRPIGDESMGYVIVFEGTLSQAEKDAVKDSLLECLTQIKWV